MEHKNRDGGANSESGVQLENKIRITTDSLTDERTAQTELESRYVSYEQNNARLLIGKRKRKKRKRCASESAIRKGNMMLEAQHDEERPQRSSQNVLRYQTQKVIPLEREKAAALVAVQDKEREIECLRKNDEGREKEKARQFAAIQTSMRADCQKLKVERDELKRITDAQLRSMDSVNVRLRVELDNAWNVIRAAEITCENYRMSEILLMQNCEALEIKKNAAIWDDKLRFEFQLAEERRLRKSLEDEMKKRDRESLATARYMEAEKQTLAAELGKQKQMADAEIQSLTSDKTSLQSELDAARISIETPKAECENELATALLEKENMEKKLALIEAERDATAVSLASQKAQDTELVKALTKEENLEGKLLGCIESELVARRLEWDRQTASQKGQDTELAKALTKKENLERQMLDGIELERVATRLELDRQTALGIEERSSQLKTRRTLMNQNRKLSHDLRRVQEKAAECNGKLVKAQDQNRTLSHDLSRLKEEAAECNVMLVQAHKNETDEARKETVQLKRKLDCFSEERNRKDFDVRRIQEEAAEYNKKLVKAHRNEMDEARTEIVQLKRKLDSLWEERNRLDFEVRRIQEEAIEDKRNLVKAHKKEMDEARTDILSLKMELGEVDFSWEETKRLECDVRRLQEEGAEDKRKLVEAQKELHKARTDITHVKMELDSSLEERNRLECDVHRLQEEAVEDERKVVKAHENELHEARTELAQLKIELESSWEERNRLERLEYDISRMQEEAAEDKRKLVQAHKNKLDQARMPTVRLKREIESLKEEKDRLEKREDDFSSMQEEAAEDKRKLVEAHKNELDGVRTHIVHARTHVVHLKTELESLRQEKNHLKKAHEAVEKNLEEEKERGLCQICLDSPKDTISFPCLHLHYCFSCLERHRGLSNTCPSCRTVISGILRSDICS